MVRCVRIKSIDGCKGRMVQLTKLEVRVGQDVAGGGGSK
jgi:hypothetical protein